MKKNIYMINGREYEWADISLNVGGVPIVGFREVRYKEAMEKEVMYAKGRDGHSIQRGNRSVDGSLKFTQSQIEALELAGGGSLLNLKVDIIVSYGAELNAKSVASAVTSTEIIKNCEFTEVEKGMAQGDKFMEIDLPFIGLKILKV